jgi:hypothetical protein
MFQLYQFLKETIRNLSPSLAAFSVTAVPWVPWVPWLKGHGKILKPNRYPEAARGCPQMAGIWKILEDLFSKKLCCMLVSHAGLIVSEPVASAFSCGSCIKGPLSQSLF